MEVGYQRLIYTHLEPKEITLQQKDILYSMANSPVVETAIKR